MMHKRRSALPKHWKLKGKGKVPKEIIDDLKVFGITTNDNEDLILSLIKKDVPLVGFQHKITPETYLRAFWYMAMTADNERCRIQALEAAAKIQGYMGGVQKSVEVDLKMPGLDEEIPATVRITEVEGLKKENHDHDHDSNRSTQESSGTEEPRPREA